MTRPRVADDINLALHGLFARDERAHLLGEDVADPYGGAFRITKGLSTEYPGRVRNTPLSEGTIVAAGAGMALMGDTAIVEIMFGDFAALGFDQILNFASKSVAMYGRRVPLRLVIRCPVGGGRGYGPTHSQSLQKHFVGIPHLSLREVTPLHPNSAVLDAALATGEPCVLFEDKVLYTERMWQDNVVDDVFRYELVDGPAGIGVVYPDGIDDVDYVIIATGGTAVRAHAAARALLVEQDIAGQVLIPSQLYPLDLTPVRDLLSTARVVCVVEESTGGGTWGAEVAHRIHQAGWNQQRGPVRLVHSAESVIPTAPHLERSVLVDQSAICHTVVTALASRKGEA